jgi:hypothetical protein
VIRIGPIVRMLAQPVQTLHLVLLPYIWAANESVLGFDGGTDLLSVEVETVVVLTLGFWFRTRLLVEPEVRFIGVAITARRAIRTPIASATVFPSEGCCRFLALSLRENRVMRVQR